MVSEIDCLMAGFCGGFMASGFLVLSLFFHFKLSYKQYLRGKEDFRIAVRVTNIEHRLDALEDL